MVGIGASAGGVEALTELFAALPPDLGAAYVVALHAELESESHLREILGRRSKMPFHVVEAATAIAPDRVYVALPGRMLHLGDGLLHVRELDRRDVTAWPLDSLFLSLAQELGSRAVAVILSGTGTHGVAGAGHVRAEAGLVIAQEPGTARHDSMPRHAVDAGVADLTLPPGGIPEALARYLDHYHLREETEEEESSRHLETALAILQARLARDFRSYRRPTLLRRTLRRAGVKQCRDLGEYVDLLRDDEAELRALAEDLMVRVTGFFRDPEAWRILEREVVPSIVAERPAGSDVRAWVAGCATGEEAYSLAILLLEEASRSGKDLHLKVFATDSSRDALAVARSGLYPEGALEHVSEERRARFFHAEDGSYQAKKGLRDVLVVSPHDLLEAPPFSRMDLVSCRNVLIYLEPQMRERVIDRLHFSLNEGGCLFLGKSESVGDRRGELEPVSKRWRVYRKVGARPRDRLAFPFAPLVVPSGSPDHGDPGARGRRPQRPEEALRDGLLDLFAPPSVLVDRQLRILYFHGATERYLRQPRGRPRQNLLDMAPHGLRSPIRRAVRAAAEGDGKAVRVPAWLSEGGSVRRVLVTAATRGVEPELLFVVSFEDTGEGEPRRRSVDPVDQEGETGAEEVERKLQDTREELWSTVEELETSNEELMASNEEISSINEELQSTNEELQTSEEELQSLNEQLATLNRQLESKVDELERTTDDLRNLLSSTDIATLFLDTHLRIRLFTPSAVRLFSLRPTDVGRPLEDFRGAFDDPGLLPDARAVLESFLPREAKIAGENGRWYVRRILPYRTEEDRIEGLVLTFADVTSLARAEEDLAKLARDLERRIAARTEHLRLLQDVAVIANSAGSPDPAVERILARVCDFNGWVAGHVYRVGDAGTLEPAGIWYVHPDAAELGERIRGGLAGVTIERGEGFPGQVLASGEARWTGGERSGKDPRVEALASAGIAAGISVPVFIREEVVAVLEFFSEHPVDLDEATLEVMGTVGTQLGRVIERARAERRLVELGLQEQQRLGEELHEGLGQQVTGVSVLARRLHRKLADAGRPEAEIAEQIREHLKEARGQVQGLAKGLIPVRVHERGLGIALQELVEEVCAAYRVDCRLEVESVEVTDEGLATSLYRIAREALNNALLHAEPRQVVVRVHQRGGALVLEVEDDGSGFPEHGEWREGLGLRIMRDRAALVGGELIIERNQDGGTTVRCAVQEGRDHGLR